MSLLLSVQDLKQHFGMAEGAGFMPLSLLDGKGSDR